LALVRKIKRQLPFTAITVRTRAAKAAGTPARRHLGAPGHRPSASRGAAKYIGFILNASLWRAD